MTQDKLYKYELGLLSMLVLILPSLEAAKTLFWFSYLCLFLYRRIRYPALSFFPHKQANIAIALYLLVTLISTYANWPFDNGFKGFLDELRFLTLFVCLSIAGYSASEYRRTALILIVGVLGGLVYGLVEFLLGMSSDFQFHSAGILTQSSIYLGTAILINTGLLLDTEDNSAKVKLFLKFALLIQLIALFYIGSRGSILAVMLILVLIALLKLNLGTLFRWFSGLTIALMIASSLVHFFPDNKFSKDIITQYSIARTQQSDSQRIGAWKVAFAKLKDGNDLLWGVGPRNYQSINNLDIIKNDKELSKVEKYGHAHNIFLTQLIEQGIAGLLVMLYFLTLVFKKIMSIWQTTTGHHISWSWYAGIGGLSIPIIAGLFNSPLYQEHAMLAMIVMGMMFGNAGHDKRQLKSTPNG